MLDEIIRKDAETFPYFLSNEFTHHIEAMSALHEIFHSIRRINCEIILDQEVLDNVCKFIDMRLVHCKDLLKTKLYIKCLDYLRYRLWLYANYNLQMENYEQVHNMQELAQCLFNKKFTFDEYEEQI